MSQNRPRARCEIATRCSLVPLSQTRPATSSRETGGGREGERKKAAKEKKMTGDKAPGVGSNTPSEPKTCVMEGCTNPETGWFDGELCRLVCQFNSQTPTATTTAQLLDWTQRSGLSHEQQQRENIRLAACCFGLQPSPLSCSRQYAVLASGFNGTRHWSQYDRVSPYYQRPELHFTYPTRHFCH
jgi:hypothetical protein